MAFARPIFTFITVYCKRGFPCPKQSCHLSILNFDELLIASECSSPGPVSLSVEVGSSRFSLFNSTSGRIMLSQLKEEEQLIYLNRNAKFSDLDETEKTSYLSEIKLVAEKGYDLKESETTKGVIDIGVPIYIPEINVLGALVVTMLSGQVQELLGSDKILNKIKDTVKSIKKNLGVNL